MASCTQLHWPPCFIDHVIYDHVIGCDNYRIALLTRTAHLCDKVQMHAIACDKKIFAIFELVRFLLHAIKIA